MAKISKQIKQLQFILVFCKLIWKTKWFYKENYAIIIREKILFFKNIKQYDFLNKLIVCK